jgi:hypothetical protein
MRIWKFVVTIVTIITEKSPDGGVAHGGRLGDRLCIPPAMSKDSGVWWVYTMVYIPLNLPKWQVTCQNGRLT